MEKKRDRLKTERLLLKPYDVCDKGRMTDLLCNEEVKRTFMIPDFDDRKQAEALFYKLLEFSRSDDHFEYGIYLHDKLIGFVNDCEMNDTTIEIGYVIDPDFQGRGFATEAVRACIEELLSMGYHHIRAGYFAENPASRRVMEKCGMHKINLEADIEYQGSLHHCLYFGIDKAK